MNLQYLLRRHTYTAAGADKNLFLLLDQEELEVGVGGGPLLCRDLIKNYRLSSIFHVVLDIADVRYNEHCG